MAGHSKWKNIQHRKGAQDAKRGKIFTKIIKEISVAVKTGGADIDANPRLRAAVANAKSVNMPKDNVDRAIKKAAGGDSDNITEINYEGYGPDGVAIFVECATDNKTRTISNVRSYFNKKGGSLGKEGCLQFVFEQKGVFTITSKIDDEDDFTMEMIDAGAEDVESDDGMVVVTCAMEDFGSIQKKLSDLNIDTEDSGLQRIPVTTKSLDKDSFEKCMKLVDALEEDDDVQKVYHNIEFDEQLLAEMS